MTSGPQPVGTVFRAKSQSPQVKYGANVWGERMIVPLRVGAVRVLGIQS